MTVGEAKYTYWKSMMEMAASSGLSKAEWCRKNCVSIKTFNHYESIFKRQETRANSYVEEHPDSPFYEIPMLNEEDVVDGGEPKEETVLLDVEDESRKEGIPKERPGACTGLPEDSVQKAYGKNPQVSIQTGNYSVLIYEGVSESVLRTVMTVMGLCHA